jgi:hypothetical protein
MQIQLPRVPTPAWSSHLINFRGRLIIAPLRARQCAVSTRGDLTVHDVTPRTIVSSLSHTCGIV